MRLTWRRRSPFSSGFRVQGYLDDRGWFQPIWVRIEAQEHSGPVVDDAECARLASRDGDHRRAAVNPSEMAGRVNGSAVLRSAPALLVTPLARCGSVIT